MFLYKFILILSMHFYYYRWYGWIWLAALIFVLIAEGALGMVGADGPSCGAGPRDGPILGAPTPDATIEGMPGRSPFPVPTAVTNACVSAILWVGCIPGLILKF